MVSLSPGKECPMGKSSFLSNGISCFFNFFLLYRGVEVKIEVIGKNKVRIFLLVLVTHSPCHVVTFQSDVLSIPFMCGLRC